MLVIGQVTHLSHSSFISTLNQTISKMSYQWETACFSISLINKLFLPVLIFCSRMNRSDVFTWELSIRPRVFSDNYMISISQCILPNLTSLHRFTLNWFDFLYFFFFWDLLGVNHFLKSLLNMLGFPGGSDGKSICLQCRRSGFNPWVGKTPWRRKWQPTSVLLPGKFHGQRSLVGYSPRGCKELDMTEQLHFFFFLLNMLLLLYYFLVFWPWSTWDLISPTRNQTRTLEGKVLTTGPPEKSP